MFLICATQTGCKSKAVSFIYYNSVPTNTKSRNDNCKIREEKVINKYIEHSDATGNDKILTALLFKLFIEVITKTFYNFTPEVQKTK